MRPVITLAASVLAVPKKGSFVGLMFNSRAGVRIAQAAAAALCWQSTGLLVAALDFC